MFRKITMNKMLLWILFVVFLKFETSFCTIECKNTEKCVCFPSANEYEFQCPPNFVEVNGFIIHVTNDRIRIDCSPNVKHFELEKLPFVNIKNATKISIQFCPLPPKNFKQVIERFSIKELTSLSFSYSKQIGLSISKEYFEDLTSLEYLSLNGNQITKLEVDVFDNTPNLLSINLEENNIKLEVDHFKKLKYLRDLDLATNKLETIPDGIFKELQTLEFLHLWSNQLQNLTRLSFLGLTNLRDLDLTSNLINNIEEDAFKHMKNFRRLSLSKNKLTSLPANLLIYNNQLEEIRISNNVNLSLPNFFFTNLTNLRRIDLSNSNINSIPNNVFLGANNIEIVKLSGNSLKLLPSDLFKDLENLKELHLNQNNFKTLTDPFKKLKKLTLLNLNNNLLKKIERNLFTDLSALEILYLNKNEISYIDPLAFFNNGNLKKIYAAHNNYSSTIGPNELFGVSINLEVVDFSHNKIRILESVIALNSKLHLKQLDFSYNHLTSLRIADLQPIDSHDTIINLEHNDIKEVNFEYVEVISRENSITYPTTILLSNNPLVCDCLNFDFLRYLKGNLYSKVYDMFKIEVENVTCTQPEDTRDILFEKLRLIDITCQVDLTCPKECKCLARPYDKSYFVDCSNGVLSTYPAIEFTPSPRLNQVELHLEFNNFTSGPSSIEVEKYYSSVTRLYLSNNYIKNISSLPANLQILKLNNNSLERLDDEFLDFLNTSSIFNLTLDGNPWICECKTENFAQYLRSHPKQVDAASSIFCANTEKAIIDLNKHSLCKEWQLIAFIVVIMSILVLCATTVAAYYRYQQEIKVWLFSKQLCLWWVTEEEVDKDKLFDAFISFSHKDEDFVTQNLLPVLESGSVPYKVCVHFRDWVPGEFITTQVAKSVYDSRRTIIILSSNFVESIWGKLEFRTAHTQAMTEGRTRVIVILHGDIDIESLDEELKAYLRTNTYVKWGDPHFWDKLKYALPHYNKIKPNKNSQKHANLMNFIDDKFNLIRSSVSSTNDNNSTPPIILAEPEILKKHPLSIEQDTTKFKEIVVEN